MKLIAAIVKMGIPFVMVKATANGRSAMSIENRLRAISNPVAAISFLAGVVIMGLAHGASGFAPAGASANPNGDPCLFSQQLQSSVAVRRQ